ncbi:MAG: hypothetical protein ACRCX2_14100 [Paraclostridium sp.]
MRSIFGKAISLEEKKEEFLNHIYPNMRIYKRKDNIMALEFMLLRKRCDSDDFSCEKCPFDTRVFNKRIENYDYCSVVKGFAFSEYDDEKMEYLEFVKSVLSGDYSKEIEFKF